MISLTKAQKRIKRIIVLLQRKNYRRLKASDWVQVIKSIMREQIKYDIDEERKSPLVAKFSDLNIASAMKLSGDHGEHDPRTEFVVLIDRLSLRIRVEISKAISRLIYEALRSNEKGREQAVEDIIHFGDNVEQGLKLSTLERLQKRTDLLKTTQEFIKTTLDSPICCERFLGEKVFRMHTRIEKRQILRRKPQKIFIATIHRGAAKTSSGAVCAIVGGGSAKIYSSYEKLGHHVDIVGRDALRLIRDAFIRICKLDGID